MKELDIIKRLKTFGDEDVIFVTLKDSKVKWVTDVIQTTMEMLRRRAKPGQKFVVLHNAEVVPIDKTNPFIVVEVGPNIDDVDIANMSAEMTEAVGIEVRVLRVPSGAKVKRS